MIISINGQPGSGKTTIAKKIAFELNYQHYYIGKIRREAAKQKGMSLAEYNTYGETHPETDLEVDEYVKKLGETQNNFVIESRTAWHLIPQSLKIFITVDPQVGATRVFNELQTSSHRNEDNQLADITAVLASHQKRIASDRRRYQKYYGIEFDNLKNFDFIIDTTNLTPDQVFSKIMNFIKQRTKMLDK